MPPQILRPQLGASYTTFIRAAAHRNAGASSAAAAAFALVALSAGFQETCHERDYEAKTSSRRAGALFSGKGEVETARFNGTLLATALVNYLLLTSKIPSLASVETKTQCESHQATTGRGNAVADEVASVEPTRNDAHEVETLPPPLSRVRRVLHSLRIASLPVPRTLTPSDPAFEYPELRAGLRQRAADELRLRSLQEEAVGARNSGDPERVRKVFEKISKVAYGEDVTPQMREDFLVRYGCTAWTDEILAYLVRLASHRGIVEIGAGNGQWARAIKDYYEEAHKDTLQRNRNIRKRFEFIIPYDDMMDLPLSPKVYHRYTKPANDYFHPQVQKCASHVDAVRKWESRGRVLLLVYPPPGPMALETVCAYVDVYPEGNDTVVYVGEGRNGANGDDGLFDYFLNDKTWVLVDVMDVMPGVGGKGYEKMFVLRRMNSLEQNLLLTHCTLQEP